MPKPVRVLSHCWRKSTPQSTTCEIGPVSKRPWRLVSVVIRSDQYSFGMLTVDSPVPDAFTELDAKNIAMMASFMAVAFSLTYSFPERDRNPRKGP